METKILSAVAALARSHMFEALTEEELEALAPILRRRTFHRREALYRTGDPGDRLHVIEQGFVKIVVEMYTGDQRIIDVLGPNCCFGELAIVDGGPRRWMVRALGPVSTVSIPLERVRHLMYSHPEMVDRVLVAYRSRIAMLMDLLADLTFLSVRERLARRLLDLGRRYGRQEVQGVALEVPLVQEDLAALVGTTRSSVNAALRQFEEQGVISLRRRQLAIYSFEALESAAALPRSIRQSYPPISRN